MRPPKKMTLPSKHYIGREINWGYRFIKRKERRGGAGPLVGGGLCYRRSRFSD